ncbi:MAG: hypothetical protein U0T83_06625 [Bacteriovoracaceae bacterium]
MKKIIVKFFLISVVLLFNLSFSWQDNSYDILNENDWNLYKQNNENPALSSSVQDEIQWKSYNKWRCFSSEKLEFSCGTVDYNGEHDVPIINIEDNEYDLSPEYTWDCKKIIQVWSKLIENEKSVCIYGAYLQDLELEKITSSLWYIERIKTSKGYFQANQSQDLFRLTTL